jgi:hypothetical protein
MPQHRLYDHPCAVSAIESLRTQGGEAVFEGNAAILAFELRRRPRSVRNVLVALDVLDGLFLADEKPRGPITNSKTKRAA